MNSVVQALGIILAGVILAGGFFYTSVFTPYQSRIEELDGEMQKLNDQAKKRDSIEGELEQLAQDIAKKKSEKAALLKNSPDLESQVPQLLLTLEDNCKKFNVKFADIRISPLIRNEQWSELPVEFTLRGTFHDLGKFLFDYEGLKLINLSKGTLQLSPTSELDPKNQKPKITAQFTGTIYILNAAGAGF